MGNTGELDPYEFNTDAEFQQAVVNSAVVQSQKANAQSAAEAAAIKSMQVVQESFLERASDARGRIADYDQVVNAAPPIELQPEFTAVLLESDKGPEMQYYLAKNFDEAQRINSLPPLQAVKELGRLEGRLSAAPPKRISAAPKPPPTVTGANAQGSKDPDDMSMADYIKWRGNA